MIFIFIPSMPLVLIYGIYLIVKGIIYYRSAEEREAMVVYSQVLNGDNYGRAYYSLTVDIEDNDEIFTVPVEGRLRLKNIEHTLKKGDKITVWYLKNSKKCVCDKSKLIKSGAGFIAAAVLMVMLIIFC